MISLKNKASLWRIFLSFVFLVKEKRNFSRLERSQENEYFLETENISPWDKKCISTWYKSHFIFVCVCALVMIMMVALIRGDEGCALCGKESNLFLETTNHEDAEKAIFITTKSTSSGKDCIDAKVFFGGKGRRRWENICVLLQKYFPFVSEDI